MTEYKAPGAQHPRHNYLLDEDVSTAQRSRQSPQ